MMIDQVVFRILIVFLSVSLSSTPLYAKNASEVYQNVGESVFTVFGYEKFTKRQLALGSAVAVSHNTLATNCHVAQMGEFRIKTKKGFKKGILSFQDYSHDLCMILVEDADFAPVKIRESRDVMIGEDVFAIGNPHGLEKSISKGIVSNKYDIKLGAVLQTDATISEGSSGGGLFDEDAKLIGITRAGHRYKDIAFTIPTEWIEEVLAGKKPHWFPNKRIVLEEIGVYGKSKIALYRFDSLCFMYFQGHGIEERDHGSMIWFPERPQQVYFLPMSTNIQESVLIMTEQGFEPEDIKKPLENVGETLSEEEIVMQEFHPIIQPTELVVKNLTYDPIQRFQSGKEVTLHYMDVYHQRLNVSLTFGLFGFMEAMRYYNEFCRGGV